MKFAVGSRRAVKLEAVEAAIGSYYGGISAEILSCDVKSDIADQPLTLSVTSIGALNRAMRSLRNTPGADMGVGLEAGIERVGDRIVDFGVVQVIGRNGVRGLGITEGIALPDEVAVLVENGAIELSDAVARVYNIDSDKTRDCTGVLTSGRLGVVQFYKAAVISALEDYDRQVA